MAQRQREFGTVGQMIQVSGGAKCKARKGKVEGQVRMIARVPS
jgi:hypothetical protein